MGKREQKIVTDNVPNERILQWNEEGEELFFSHEEFRELPDSLIRELSYVNQRNYWLAKGAHEQSEKQRIRAENFGDLKVLDPLGGEARNKVQVRNPQPGYHYCWKRPDEVASCQEIGYELVPNDDGTVTPGASHTSSSRVVRRRDGSDDIVLMRIPDRTYKQHLEAVAFESAKRSGRTFEDLKRALKRVHKDLDLIDTTQEEVVREPAPVRG